MKKCCFFALLLALLMACAAGMAQEAGETAPRKVVYLTFDDGPKSDTLDLLAILREENVPATFFFVGNKVRMFPEQARQVYADGHAIGSHSMKHAAKTFKIGLAYTQKDKREFMEVMQEVVDPDFTTDLFRFPGGSTGYGGYGRQGHEWVREAGMAWFDWNAMTADTEAGKTAQDLYDYAVKTTGDQEVVILLAHEGIKRTQQILPDLIAFYRENGYEFRTLSTGAEDRALLSRCGARMMLPRVNETNETNEMEATEETKETEDGV